MASVDTFAVNTLLLCLSYFTVDAVFIICIQEVENEFIEGQNKAKTLRMQMIVHHIVALSGIVFTLIMGYGAILILNLNMLCELSNFFLSLRSMYKKEELNTLSGRIVGICFAFTFFTHRMILWPYVYYLMLKSVSMHWVVYPTYAKVASVLFLIEFLILFSIQVSWWLLIWKSIRKLLDNFGKKGEKSDKVDKLDEMKKTA